MTDRLITVDTRDARTSKKIHAWYEVFTLWSLCNLTFRRYGSVILLQEPEQPDWKRFDQFLDLNDNELSIHCDEWLTHEEAGFDGGREGIDEEDDEIEEDGEDGEDEEAETNKEEMNE